MARVQIDKDIIVSRAAQMANEGGGAGQSGICPAYQSWRIRGPASHG